MWKNFSCFQRLDLRTLVKINISSNELQSNRSLVQLIRRPIKPANGSKELRLEPKLLNRGLWHRKWFSCYRQIIEYHHGDKEPAELVMNRFKITIFNLNLYLLQAGLKEREDRCFPGVVQYIIIVHNQLCTLYVHNSHSTRLEIFSFLFSMF